jgi:uncharacterized protein (TIGR03382 family)
MRIAVPVSLLLVAGTAHAHIEMTNPIPRSTAQKTGPCGAAGSTRSANVTTFAPGETITVEWTETVDHPGHFRIAFDDDGSDAFLNPNNPDDNFPSTLIDQIADKAGGRYTQQVTLPSTPCTNCTLQLVQVMTTAIPYNSFYFQCADLVIAVGGGSGSGSGSGSGDPDGGIDELEGGCSTGGGTGAGAGLLLGMLALIRRRR